MLKRLAPLFLLFVLFSCSSDVDSENIQDAIEQEANTGNTKDKSFSSSEDLLVRHWLFINRVSNDGKKSIEYGDESSQRLIHFEVDGFFKVYDSITDQRILDKGVSRIEQLSSGNWELKNEGKLLRLNYRNNDNVDVEEYEVKTLTSSELVTYSDSKGTNTYLAK